MASTDGKKAGPKPQKSGAQKRREKKEREEAAIADVVAKAKDLGIKVAPGTEPEPEDDAWAEEFEEAGNPDLENVDTDLSYVRKLQLICLRQMATTAHPSKAQQEAWRRIREMSAVVGMTSNRAKLETDLRDVKKQLAAYKERNSPLSMEAGNEVVRPGTARGQRSSRGPRPLGPGAGASPSEDT